jgi:hypothetical protein
MQEYPVINIESIVFLDPDDGIFIDGLREYRDKHDSGESIEPIEISHRVDGKFYARGGRHRTYFFYNYLGRKTIPYIFTGVFDDTDRRRIEHHEVVTVRDLIVLEEIEWTQPPPL